jgi:hypothetical protein
VSCPLPSAADIPPVRALFVAMEAMFSFLFWTMKSKKKDYRMGVYCPWERKCFAYDGISSHNPLWEGVTGDFELTPQQREAMAATLKQKNKERDAIRNPLYHQYQLAENADYYRTRGRKNTAHFRKFSVKYEESRDKNRVKCKVSRHKVKKSGIYSCGICNVTCYSETVLDRHERSKRHLQAVELLASGKEKKEKSGPRKSAEKALAEHRFVCKICDIGYRSNWELSRHNESKRPLSKVAASGASTSGSA